ncbi:MAG TPA: creatininase family protein [Phycisphaerae bacterium]|nr:creatininase family protein [Phycisphaerae bacterium]
MQWEELTSDEFAAASAECGRVCVMALGCLERHGPHMPLGTDMINGHRIAVQAAQREPAIVFPPWMFAQIYEAKCFPGTITLPPTMLVELMLTIYDEIGRNGLTKIITYIAHGGNNHLANFLCQCQLHEHKPYQLYAFSYGAGMTDQQRARWKAILETDGGGHAGESETSIAMHHCPELVKMKATGGRSGVRQGRMDHVKAGFNGFWWYGDYPEHWAGEPATASAEKGKALSALQAEALAAFIRAVKQDEITPKLAQEFFRREAELRS